MTISVIIPAWNAQRHIARAIQSVLAQTQPADEIIIVDDGSTDNTVETVRTFGSKVRLITQPNAGASVARNTGVAAAKSDWIAFLDADDEWLPEKIHAQIELFRQFSHLKWGYANYLTNYSGKQWHKRSALPAPKQHYMEDYLDAYCKGFHAWTGTVMIHRSVFDTVGLFEPGMKRAQDNDLWFRIAYQFPQVGYIPQSLAVYHLDTPDSSTKINDSVDYMINLIDRHRTLSQKFNRAGAFRPCIAHMLQVWIRQLEKQNRRADINSLLGRYRSELSPQFCREMRFRMSLPPLTSRVADMFLSVKNHIRKAKPQCPKT
jgi:glycosyltransferase involved in cell wall biosynthesis